MKLTPAILTFALIATGLVPMTSRAARPVQPPLLELTRNQNFVMAAVAKTRLVENKVVFEQVAPLSGNSEPTITLRMDDETYADVVAGKTYVVAYSSIIGDPHVPEAKIVDPEGPRVLRVRGYGSRALFEDSRELRFLFETARADEAPGDERILSALLTQMIRPDHRTRALAIVEFYLRPELHHIVRGRSEKTIRSVIADDTLHTELKSFLLQTALDFPEAETRTWLRAAYREVIDTSGTQYDLTSFVPGLVETAVKGLAVLGDESDIDRLSALLETNAPSVAEAAIETLDGLDRQVAMGAVTAALERPSLPQETRRVLETYFLERLKSPDDLDVWGM